jgi:carbonic anhydrase
LQLDAIEDKAERLELLCELNVVSQVSNVCHTAIVQNAWQRGQPLAIHGWVYSLKDGLLKDLNCTVDSVEQVADAYRIDA